MVGEKINPSSQPHLDPSPSRASWTSTSAAEPNPDTRELFGELESIAATLEYPTRDARLDFMDGQGMGAPSCCRPSASAWNKPAATTRKLSSPPSGLQPVDGRDWGFSYKERIFAAPIFTPGGRRRSPGATELGAGEGRPVRAVAAAVRSSRSGGRSPSDPIYDPFWQRERSGVTVLVLRWGQLVFQLHKDWGEKARTRRSGRKPSGLSCRTTKRRPLRESPGTSPLPPIPEPEDRLHRTGSGLGVPPVRQAQEVVRSDSALTRGPRQTFMRHA